MMGYGNDSFGDACIVSGNLAMGPVIGGNDVIRGGNHSGLRTIAYGDAAHIHGKGVCGGDRLTGDGQHAEGFEVPGDGTATGAPGGTRNALRDDLSVHLPVGADRQVDGRAAENWLHDDHHGRVAGTAICGNNTLVARTVDTVTRGADIFAFAPGTGTMHQVHDSRQSDGDRIDLGAYGHSGTADFGIAPDGLRKLLARGSDAVRRFDVDAPLRMDADSIFVQGHRGTRRLRRAGPPPGQRGRSMPAPRFPALSAGPMSCAAPRLGPPVCAVAIYLKLTHIKVLSSWLLPARWCWPVPLAPLAAPGPAKAPGRRMSQ